MATPRGVCDFHSFPDLEELDRFRSELLGWYDVHKRELPWRTLAAAERDANRRAYGVWVSEVMLQQTQVATVIDYYNRWMKKWPTVEDLAAATLEDVRVMWSGLGYYSRGRRLWEGAKKVVDELDGVIPSSAEELVKTLPGVGRYTAGAIASIAFGEVTGVVDGNVMRVLSRHRLIGAEANKQSVIQHFWELANTCVDSGRPGDYNQAVMELGATVCTPKSPLCGSCPLRSSCVAFNKVNKRQQKTGLHRYSKHPGSCSQASREDGEEVNAEPGHAHCPLCLPEEHFDPAVGVANYPRKGKKKEPPLEHYAVVMMENSRGQLLLRQRPQTGLLAGLWEFPMVPVEREEPREEMWEKLRRQLMGERATDMEHVHVGLVVHQFSHVHYHCHCWHIKLSGDDGVIKGNPLLDIEHSRNTNWIDKSLLTQQPISTLVKKIFQLIKVPSKQLPEISKMKSRPRSNVGGEKSAKRQKTIEQFFSKS